MTTCPTSASERRAPEQPAAVDHAGTDAGRDRQIGDGGARRAGAEPGFADGRQIGVVGDADGQAEVGGQAVRGQLVRPLRREVGRPEEPAGFVVDRAGKPDDGVRGRAVVRRSAATAAMRSVSEAGTSASAGVGTDRRSRIRPRGPPGRRASASRRHPRPGRVRHAGPHAAVSSWSSAAVLLAASPGRIRLAQSAEGCQLLGVDVLVRCGSKSRSRPEVTTRGPCASPAPWPPS